MKEDQYKALSNIYRMKAQLYGFEIEPFPPGFSLDEAIMFYEMKILQLDLKKDGLDVNFMSGNIVNDYMSTLLMQENFLQSNIRNMQPASRLEAQFK